jgi:hypothetical protein
MRKINIVALGLVLIASCKKDEKKKVDDNPTPTTSTKQEKLVNGKWQITELYIEKDGTVGYDHMSSMAACEKDNMFTFNSDATISSDEGATKCDASVDQVTTDGNWSIDEASSTLVIKDSKLMPMMENTTTKIASISDLELRLSKDTVIEYPGLPKMSGTVHVNFKNVK